MSIIADPSKRGQTPYDALSLDQNATRNAITTAYARARRDRSKNSQLVSQAHEQLTRSASRLRTDFLFYDTPDLPQEVQTALRAVDLANLALPLPGIPLTELLDLDAVLAALPEAPRRPAEASSREISLGLALPLRFDR